MKLQAVLKSWATLGPIGYLPAPGTMATLCALMPVILLGQLNNGVYTAVLVVVALMSYAIINTTLSSFKHKDPSEIVIDEVLGCLVAFYACTLTLPALIAGFCMFRVFDIYKPLGIRYLERLPGALGILLDDVAAGLLTACMLYCLGC